METHNRPGVVMAIWTLALLGGTAIGPLAVASHAQVPAPSVKAAPCSAINSVEGKNNFDAYCAVRHGGKFDRAAVEYVIRGTGKTATPVHGTADMPVWGTVFASIQRAP